MAKKEKKTVFNILDNTLDWYCTDEAYEEYKDWCEMNDIEPSEKNSGDFWDWANDNINLNIECDFDNMAYAKIKDRTFVITGTLGLWDGNHPVVHPVIENGLVDTIMKCVSSSDIWDYDVFINDDEDYITVHAKHHDGTNVFEIHLLTHEGAKAYEEAYEKWNYQDGPELELKPEYFEKIEFNKIF